jgi:hypothetical protein
MKKRVTKKGINSRIINSIFPNLAYPTEPPSLAASLPFNSKYIEFYIFMGNSYR